MKILQQPFISLPSGEAASLFTLENDKGLKISVSDYGCTVVSLLVPDRNCKTADVVAGYKDKQLWIRNDSYFGSLIGRTCNRIANGRFTIDGRHYQVSVNHGEDQLHGGFEGFSRKVWKAATFRLPDSVGIDFEYLSPDGEEGFPGNLNVKMRYLLNNDNEFRMEAGAITDNATVINLTNHAYFNLAGEDSGNIYRHLAKIEADFITEVNQRLIPTGKFAGIRNTAHDFTSFKAFGEHIHSIPMGYDDNFVLRDQEPHLKLAATVIEPDSGRKLEILTTEPGIQLYTSNWADGSIIGKGGKGYLKHHAFALETQHFPDAVNHPEFPPVVLYPEEKYHSTTVWRFSITDR